MTRRTLENELRAELEARGCTIKALARETDLTAPTLGRMLKGAPIFPDTLEAVLRAFPRLRAVEFSYNAVDRTGCRTKQPYVRVMSLAPVARIEAQAPPRTFVCQCGCGTPERFECEDASGFEQVLL